MKEKKKSSNPYEVPAWEHRDSADCVLALRTWFEAAEAEVLRMGSI